MHITPSLVISAVLAGQIAAHYIPLRARVYVTEVQTEVRTVYSTKVVSASASPSNAGINRTDGLPIAPSISRLSIPLSSIVAVGVNPINGLPVPTGTVRKTTTKKPTSTKAPVANSSVAAGIAGIIGQAQKQSTTKTAAAGIASIIAQLPKPSTTKTAAAGIASILAHLPKSSSSKTATGIVIVPVTMTVKTTQKPQATIASKDAKAMNLLASLSAAQN